VGAVGSTGARPASTFTSACAGAERAATARRALENCRLCPRGCEARRLRLGEERDAEDLAAIVLSRQERGCHNLNLVTAARTGATIQASLVFPAPVDHCTNVVLQ
jgi:uncharacterized Fe-S radical SAM superfamily protein PflX